MTNDIIIVIMIMVYIYHLSIVLKRNTAITGSRLIIQNYKGGNDMNCVICGKENPDHASFCLYCGAKVSQKYNKEYSTPTDKFEWNTLKDGTVVITQFLGEDESVVIPAEIDGNAVTEIGHSLFYGNTSLESITIPE